MLRRAASLQNTGKQTPSHTTIQTQSPSHTARKKRRKIAAHCQGDYLQIIDVSSLRVMPGREQVQYCREALTALS